MLAARQGQGETAETAETAEMVETTEKYVGDDGNDIQRLDSTVEHYFLHSLAESTRKTYNSAKRRYSEFAAKHGFQPFRAPAMSICKLPGRGHSTIKCYLSAVRQMHVAEGYGDPCMSSMARLEQVLKGIKSLQARSLPPSHNPRSAAKNERGVAEKRYHLGQQDAIGSLGSTGIGIYGS